MSYIFLKSVFDAASNLRVRALEKQGLDTKLNIASDKVIRSKYPAGTIFVTEILRTNSTGTHYLAGAIKVLLESAPSVEKASAEAFSAYEKLYGPLPSASLTSAPKGTTPPKKIVVRRTLFERIKDNYACPTIDEDGFSVSQSNWHLLVRNIQTHTNTMLVGPTGSGKTELVQLACEKMGIPCHIYDMGAMFDPVASLLGVHRLVKGESVFDRARFTEDIQEECVILLDELSRAPVASLNILFPCLDSRRFLPLELAGAEDERQIKVHPKCTFVATANIGAEYVGTNMIDKALMNRFFTMELSYASKEQEENLLINRCGLKREVARKVTQLTESVRDIYQKGDLSNSVSIRESLMIGALISDGWSPLSSAELVLLPQFEGTDVEGERSIVKRLISVL